MQLPSKTRQVRRLSDGPSRGFALIVAIALMAFILMLLLSLSAIVQVELQGSSNTLKKQLAMEHARFGMLTAFGRMQKAGGPDQRVSATALALDDPANGADDVLAGNQNWVAFWDADAGSATYGQAIDVGSNQSWMISGSASDPLTSDYNAQVNASGQALSTDYALLLGPGSVADRTDFSGTPVYSQKEQYVVAPKEALNEIGGAYAWWVGDEGLKARVTSVDSQDYASLSATDQSYLKLAAPQRAGVQLMSGLDHLATLTTGQRNLLQTQQQLGLFHLDTLTASKERYHEVSQHSVGVLADTRNGGLRRDLSYELDEDNPAFSSPSDYALADDTGIFGPLVKPSSLEDPGGPLWGQIRSYYNIDADGSTVTVQPQFDTTQGVIPIITQFQIWHHAYYYEDDSVLPNQLYVRFLVMPYVVVNNPYNKRLAIPNVFFRMMHAHAPEDDKFDPEFSVRIDGSWGTYFTGAIGDFTNNVAKGGEKVFPSGTTWPDVNFSLAATVFEPGETKLFTPILMDDLGLLPSDNNVLHPADVAGTGPGTAFYYDIPATNFTWAQVNDVNADSTKDVDDLPGIQIDGEHSNDLFVQFAMDSNYSKASTLSLIYRLAYWGIDETQWGVGTPTIPAMVRKESGMAGAPMDTSDPDFPNFGSDHSMRQSLTLMQDLIPNGYASSENYIQWLAQYNPRANLSGRDPYSWNLGFVGGFAMNPSYIGSFQTSQSGKVFFDVIGAPSPRFGYADMDPAGNKAVLFEFPTDAKQVHSIGQLMHVNFSRNYDMDFDGDNDIDDEIMNDPADIDMDQYYFFGNYHPAYAVGNSVADPRINDTETWLDWSVVLNGSDGNGQRRLGIHYDYSWHLNEALWDRYFFSTIKAEDNLADPDLFPLPNGRLQPYGNPTAGELWSYREGAAHLLLEGGFNVNSVSPEAWALQLASFLDVNTSQDAADPDLAPYARLRNPVQDDFDSEDFTDEDAYLKYRRLDRSQIEELATSISEELRSRSAQLGRPFLSLADFVNRSLESSVPAAHREVGPLQAAIDSTNFNQDVTAPDSDHTPEFPGPDVGPRSRGIPTYLTQADLLSQLGSLLTARSDTFVIRSYGESRNPVTDEIESRAWCEALIQRLPEYVDTANVPEQYKDDTGAWEINATNRQFGRRFRLISFRWLNKEDV